MTNSITCWPERQVPVDFVLEKLRMMLPLEVTYAWKEHPSF